MSSPQKQKAIPTVKGMMSWNVDISRYLKEKRKQLLETVGMIGTFYFIKQEYLYKPAFLRVCCKKTMLFKNVHLILQLEYNAG